MSPNTPLVTQFISKPLFDTTFVNVDYYFYQVLVFVRWIGELHAGSTIYLVSYILSLFGITLIIYSLVRMVEIYREELGHLQHAIAEYAERHNEAAASGKNERWEHIQDLVNSPSESDWRLGIIEADSVLEGLLDARGISGAGIGAKLKSISPGDLGSMQAAWEAHLVRNRIAHEGLNYELSQRDARRTIQLYEVVFRELGFL
jgi:hypothetical protein